MAEAGASAKVEAALTAERQLVLTLGGFALEIAGAVLVTHEKIPASRFNFVGGIDVGEERQTAFFERALDHYFQRAIRPSFRVGASPPAHLDRGLRSFGFRPDEDPEVLWLWSGVSPRAPPSDVRVREATSDETELVTSFWSSERERPELRTAVDIVRHHPNPQERLVPLLALLDGQPASAALAYRYREAEGIHLLTTRPEARDRGCASALLAHALARPIEGPPPVRSIVSQSPRAEPRLRELGFVPARTFQRYVLPGGAALPTPAVGPPGPPRWRPPRAPVSPDAAAPRASSAARGTRSSGS